MRSRTISPEIPAFATADQAIDLALAGIEHKQDPDDLAISGMQLEVIRAPSDIRVQRDDNPIMRAARTMGGMTFEYQSVVLHDPEHPLHVDGGLASAA